jgi:AcrR family transcriptional regulator
MSKRSAEETRTLLLTTARRIILEQGIGRLTLDEVAKQAGVSKGGLLYHFASKDALIEGLIRYLIADYERQIAEAMTGDPDPDPRGRFTRAYLKVNFSASTDEFAVFNGLAAVVDLTPELLALYQSAGAVWRERLCSDGIKPAVALVVALCADGLWLGDMTHLSIVDDALRQSMYDTLIDLINHSRT